MVRSKVPRVKGWLAASVATIAAPMFGGEGAAVGMGGGEVPYAGWIEFGGSRGRPLVAGGRYLSPTAEHDNDAARAAETVRRRPDKETGMADPERW